jgi:membrane associated rhomboid family serine protease
MFDDRKKLVMCQACRALVEASASACPLCGKESVPPRRARAGVAAESSSFISLIILTVNVLLFVLMAVVEVRNGRGGEAFFQSASNAVLDDFGALNPALVAAGQWWRLVTFNFLHIGLMHLLFNSSALFQIGPQVEELYGSQKFVVIYMVTGTTSAAASFLFNIGGAGASGAIFGLIGLMAVYGYKLGGAFGKAITRQMLIWAGIGFMFGVMIGANNVAHASGFFAGAALAFLIKPDAPATNRAFSGWNAAAIASILVLVSSFALAGKNYGDAQERSVQARNVILLADRIRDASKAWDDSIPTPDSKPDPHQIAQTLKNAATGLDNTPPVDERSTEIRKRIAEIINRRAAAFDSAGQSETALMQAAATGFEEANDAFKSYFDWENSVLDKYGLVRGKR